MCNDTEEWWKIWRGIDLPFQNWHQEFDEFWLEHSKVSKTCTLMGWLWQKFIMLELNKEREVIFHDTGEWYKLWKAIDLSVQNWQEEFNKFWS